MHLTEDVHQHLFISLSGFLTNSQKVATVISRPRCAALATGRAW